MAICGVIVIPGAVEIGGHQADRIKAVLGTQSSAELNSGNLGDGVPLIGGLQGTCKKALLLDRLLGEFGIDAGASEEQKPPAAMAQAASITLF